MSRTQWPHVLRLQTWQALNQVHKHVTKGLEEELRDRAGLDLASCEVLIAVQEAGGRIGQRLLLEWTSPSQSGLSRLLNRMSDAGLVHREHQSTDRRQWDVVLTATGTERLRVLTPLYNDLVHGFFGSKLTDRDAESSYRSLRKVLESAEEPRQIDSTDLEPVALAESVLAVTSEAVQVSNALVIRNALEPLLMEEAARHRDEQDIRDLHAILADLSRGMTSAVEYVHPHWQLHLRIAQITPNTLLREQYIQLADNIRHKLHIVIPEAGLPDFIPKRVALHAEIVAAIADGDIVRSRQLAVTHQLGTPGRLPHERSRHDDRHH